MDEADETEFKFHFMQLSSLVWLLPVVIFFAVNYLYNRYTPINDEASFTACSNPLCARCQQYQVLRQRANETIQALVTEENKHALTRIIEGLGANKFHHRDQQCNVFYLPGLSAKPFWPTANLEDTHLENTVRALEENASIIADEYESAVKTSSLWTSNTAETGQWHTFYLYNQGKRIDQNCEVCPRTSKLLENLSDFMKGCVFGNALFSVVEPGTLITEHYGPTNTRLRCHLGILVPQGVTLTVRGRPYTWTEGKCLLFDDSFLHAVESRDAREDRAVLILDLWHPHITDVEKETLSKLFP